MELISIKRRNKIRFYAKGFAQHVLVPNAWFRSRLASKLARINRYDPQWIQERVEYYNKLNAAFNVSAQALDLKSIPSTKQTAYYYDMRALLRHYPPSCRIDYKFGDNRDTAEIPTLVKSRAVGAGNDNNVLLKLNQVRHFMTIKDRVSYADKKNMLVWRGAARQQHRKDFLVKFWNHSLCDVGQVNSPARGGKAEWVKPRMSIAEQLNYKFILSIEGHDVATNLKWIAQSNSLCFMTRPKYETWMMEGRLVGGQHYVELREDYADLPEKIEYYTRHSEEANEIINNLQEYYRQFQDPVREELISLLVLNKYLKLSGQIAEV
ncbi:lipopolysaccharide A protein [Verrucomicrobia bacterium S94]|nr:lipopolysaccharide A protein [Verrucomicrobia bacterium S94]